MALTLRRSAMVTQAVLAIVLLFAVAYSATPAAGLGRGMVGGRTKIKDVETNEAVQELGRYSVEEYNRSHSKRHEVDGGEHLVFSQVVEAEKQVVSGIKYYLKIEAMAIDKLPETFDAVVVVKPWMHSKELLNFSPSPAIK
ncbi:unnamed protein product [Ilex paraguariensis]|uniref:Cystatin domain-containing protein n=1 Tax=Ilex paraguariensis TaxID=185542 RepID=A0ABC8SH50_9AQUA